MNEREEKKMFINDLSIELETVHITDDFETHKRTNAGIRPYTCIRHKSKSLCRAFRAGIREMEEQQRQQSRIELSEEKCPTHRGKMTVSSF